MLKTITKYQRPFFLLFAVLTVIYFTISLFYFVGRHGGGDEELFIADLDFVVKQGLIAGIEKQISVPYTMLAYPFALFMKTLAALRAVNILLLIFLFLYFIKIVGIKSKPFYFYLMFYLATVNFFFAGLNDPLFLIGLAVFFIEVFCYLEKGKMNHTGLAFSALVIAFFTRQLVMIYAPVILLAFFLLYRKGFRPSKKLWFPALLFVFFIGMNIPSLVANHKLSYDDKKPPEGVNWAQRQYLAQLWVNEGKIKNFSHPSWEETKAYLQANGPDSLPDGIVNGMTHDIGLTIKEFFKGLYYSLFFGFRQLGLMIVFPFWFLIRGLAKRQWTDSLFIPVIMATVISIFSLIIISYIELRWYGAIFIPSLVFFAFYSEKERHGQLLLFCNYIILSLLSLYGIYGVAIRFL